MFFNEALKATNPIVHDLPSITQQITDTAPEWLWTMCAAPTGPDVSLSGAGSRSEYQVRRPTTENTIAENNNKCLHNSTACELISRHVRY